MPDAGQRRAGRGRGEVRAGGDAPAASRAGASPSRNRGADATGRKARGARASGHLPVPFAQPRADPGPRPAFAEAGPPRRARPAGPLPCTLRRTAGRGGRNRARPGIRRAGGSAQGSAGRVSARSPRRPARAVAGWRGRRRRARGNQAPAWPAATMRSHRLARDLRSATSRGRIGGWNTTRTRPRRERQSTSQTWRSNPMVPHQP